MKKRSSFPLRMFFRILLMVLCAAITVLFILFAAYRYKVGLARYFDSDELAYISWSWHFLHGVFPYRDFLFISLPGYLLALMPVLATGEGVFGPLVSARIFSWIISLVFALSLVLVARRLARGWWNIVAGLVILFLPLPSDKFMEIRPDTLSYLFVFFGLALQMREMESSKGLTRFNTIIGIGVLYGLALVFFTKALVPVGIASLFFVLFLLVRPYSSPVRRIQTTLRCGLLYALSLAVIPASAFFWGARITSIQTMWYTITRMPVEISRMMLDYYISPEQFFYTNNIVYGLWGKHLGYQYNLALWGIGAAWAIVTLLVGLLSYRKQKDLHSIIVPLLAVAMTASYYYIPVHHTQYLIPLAAFVAIFVSDFVGFLYRIMSRRIGTHIVFFIASGYALILMYQGFWFVYPTKLAWNNTNVQADLALIHTYIPETAPVYDIVGMAYRNPYAGYTPCLPVGQFSQYLSRPLPSVLTALQHTNYIYQGGGLRVNTLSAEDQAYISLNFVPDPSKHILIRKGIPWVPITKSVHE